MRTVNDFIDFIEITYREKEKDFSHHPFYMVTETDQKQHEIYCLMDAKSVTDVYHIFLHALLKGIKKAYFSIDFPAAFDMKNDFILITEYNTDPKIFFNLIAIPYDNKTGEIFDTVKEGLFLAILHKQFTNFLKEKLINSSVKLN